MQMDKEYLEKINVENDSPGPAAYFVKPTIGQGATDPTIEKNPAYSIRGRLVKNNGSGGPGPAYDTSQLGRFGRYRTPGGNMGHRWKAASKRTDTPGPAHYCPKWATRTAGFRMGPLSSRKPVAADGPGPNSYTLPSTLSKRAARLFGRERANVGSTGPGPYDVRLPEQSRGRSFGRRVNVNVGPPTPGPADYNVRDASKCCAPLKYGKKSTFGSRPNLKAVVGFAVLGDNVCDECC